MLFKALYHGGDFILFNLFKAGKVSLTLKISFTRVSCPRQAAAQLTGL